MAWSLLIKNGTVIDGSGGARRSADVALEGDRIGVIAPRLEGEAAQVIDAQGLMVAPGFIDIHSHSDFFYQHCPSAESKVRQGVTTEVVGMCSFSPAPVHPDRRHLIEELAASLGSRLEIAWSGFAQYLDYLDSLDLSVNVVHFVGHGALRLAAMGADDRSPSPTELARMKELLKEAVEAGAYGFSTGLVYAPSAFADTQELVELARSMVTTGGLYFSHIRGEANTLVEAVEEAIRIAAESGVGLQIAHIKAAGRENWPKMDTVLGLIDEARGRGLDVSADVYPYAASSTVMVLLLPRWAHDGGTPELVKRLANAEIRQRIVSECTQPDGRWGTPAGSVAWDDVMIATCGDPRYEGMTIAELAAKSGRPGSEAMMDLLMRHDGKVSMVLFSQSEENVRKAIRHSAVMIGSDSIGLTCGSGPHPGKPHPRMYGSFPRVLGRYVREQELLSWEEGVARMTGRPAEKLGLRDRGLLREGFFADVMIFDPQTIGDEATFRDPHRYPRGVSHVIVNGDIVVEGDRFHSLPAGRVLRH